MSNNGDNIAELYRRPAPIAERIFAALRDNPYGLPHRILADVVYGGLANGGPEDAQNAIDVCIAIMNRRLARAGWGLRVRSSGNLHGYQIYVVRPSGQSSMAPQAERQNHKSS
jgi:hypothetical protein